MSDDWSDTLGGDDDSGPEDARIIRAIVRSHAEVTEQGIDEDQVAAAKAELLSRLQHSNVVRPARWTAQRKKLRYTGMLMAASAAIIAIGILTFSSLDTSSEYDPIVIASYADIDTVRGLQDSTFRMVVDNPDAYGQMLAGQLTDLEIPFVLLSEYEDASDRILKVQVDGHPNANTALLWLQDLGISDAPTSVVVIRLIAGEGP